MAAAPPTPDAIPQARLPRPAVSWIFAKHLASLLIPFTTLLFLWTGPHPWYIAPLFMLPPLAAMHFDSNDTIERRQPVATTPAWPFDLLVYFLAAVQLWIVYEVAELFSRQGFFSIDMVMVVMVVGSSSGFSIITAHELIHRRNRAEQALGRVLLASVLQEHFYTEHLRGHHAKVGTADDPATARFGEPFESFYRRTVPAQWKSAWRLECRRIADEGISLFDRRQLGNRVIHGIILGWGAGLAILATFGVPSFFAFLLQAFMASRLLEAVNYFEHWGLERTKRRVQPEDSWDTHAWFTYYGLTGLSRHADHHAKPSRPYQQLRVFEEAPILPTGYVGMVDMVLGRNTEFQKLAVGELMRRGLGPFRPGGDPEKMLAARETAEAILARPIPEPGGWFGPSAKGETGSWIVARRFLITGALLLALTLGVQFEDPGAMAFGARFALNVLIFASFVLTLKVFRALLEQDVPISVSGAAAMAVNLAVGVISAGALSP